MWAVGVIPYSTGIIGWTIQDIKRMDIQTQKIITMNGALHPRSNIGRSYPKKCKVGRGLLSVEECVVAETKSLRNQFKGKNEKGKHLIRRGDEGRIPEENA